MTEKAIVFLGCGAMNEAILAGLLAAGIPRASMTATVRGRDRAQDLAGRYGVSVVATAEDARANQQAVRESALVILGVSPLDVAGLAEVIAPALPASAVVVSVASGVGIARLEELLPPGQAVIRAMPNMATRLGRGVVSLTGGSCVSREQLDCITDLFAGLGLVVEVPEEQIDAVSAVSGSGPAYVYYLARAMADAGTRLGLDPDLSARLARRTVAGAGYLLAENDADPEVLLKPFVGPDTATRRAIDVFDERGLPGIIADGAQASHERSRGFVD